MKKTQQPNKHVKTKITTAIEKAVEALAEEKGWNFGLAKYQYFENGLRASRRARRLERHRWRRPER